MVYTEQVHSYESSNELFRYCVYVIILYFCLFRHHTYIGSMLCTGISAVVEQMLVDQQQSVVNDTGRDSTVLSARRWVLRSMLGSAFLGDHPKPEALLMWIMTEYAAIPAEKG